MVSSSSCVYHLCRHLEYNSLVEVNSGSLYGLTALHQLHLSNNSISRIQRDGWSFCQKLHELYVWGSSHSQYLVKPLESRNHGPSAPHRS